MNTADSIIRMSDGKFYHVHMREHRLVSEDDPEDTFTVPSAEEFLDILHVHSSKADFEEFQRILRQKPLIP